MSAPILTGEVVQVQIPATVALYENGVRMRSVDVVLLAPSPPPPLGLSVATSDATHTAEWPVVAFGPHITWTREVRVSDATKTTERVVV